MSLLKQWDKLLKAVGLVRRSRLRKIEKTNDWTVYLYTSPYPPGSPASWSSVHRVIVGEYDSTSIVLLEDAYVVDATMVNRKNEVFDYDIKRDHLYPAGTVITIEGPPSQDEINDFNDYVDQFKKAWDSLVADLYADPVPYKDSVEVKKTWDSSEDHLHISALNDGAVSEQELAPQGSQAPPAADPIPKQEPDMVLR